ncbi:MAG: MaoC/PaaZ C-terminal domain-containing protein [Halioglobus sp.]
MAVSRVETQESAEAQKLESLKGQRLGPYMSFNPVSATQIWQWCSAMGDLNPTFSRGQNQLAPPAMMQMWTMRDINDCYAPGSTDAPPYQVFDDMKALGYGANVAVSYDIKFIRYLSLGERPKHYTTVVSISDKKTTALGLGFFVTERVEYTTLEEAPFAEALITYFQYQPAERADDQAVSESSPSPSDLAAGRKSAPGPAQWQTEFENLALESLSIGDKLPTLNIPITHKLIVGGAIATQDYIPVHHNVPAANAAAMPDIFMNILTTSGLLARYLGDWAGRGSRLQHIKFNLMAPNHPGDTMEMEGSVESIRATDTGGEVVVNFGGKNRQGYHTRGNATLALPGNNELL